MSLPTKADFSELFGVELNTGTPPRFCLSVVQSERPADCFECRSIIPLQTEPEPEGFQAEPDPFFRLHLPPVDFKDNQGPVVLCDRLQLWVVLPPSSLKGAEQAPDSSPASRFPARRVLLEESWETPVNGANLRVYLPDVPAASGGKSPNCSRPD